MTQPELESAASELQHCSPDNRATAPLNVSQRNKEESYSLRSTIMDFLWLIFITEDSYWLIIKKYFVLSFLLTERLMPDVQQSIGELIKEFQTF